MSETTTAAAAPLAHDVKAFIPSRAFELSLRFYEAMGWQCNWRHDGLAEREIGKARFYLQKYYVREWAENAMLYIDVDDALAWHQHAQRLVVSGEFPGVRTAEPRYEEYGAMVTFVWDPCGVLLHFAQPVERPPMSTPLTPL